VLRNERFDVRLTIDGVVFDKAASAVLVANLGAVLNDLVAFGDGILRDDGLLNACVFAPTTFGDSLILAKQLIASERGTRFVQATSYGWDNHTDIYNQIRNRARELDTALGSLIDDLTAMPGSEQGKTLLDETLIVIYSEFGRTVGPPTGAGGRDHFARMSIVFAGGGVRGNRVVGKTDAQGSKVVEYGWRGNRDVRPEDVTATIYSALGIDYTTVRKDDPLGRGFEYVPFAKDGTYKPVDELF